MKITANILTADQPTVNGRVYTKAVLEGIVKQLEGKDQYDLYQLVLVNAKKE